MVKSATTKKICPICGREITLINYSKHLRGHTNHPEKYNSVYKLNHDGLSCQFCGKECKNRNSLCGHERLCKENPNRQESTFVKYNAERDHAWNKGLTKETDERVAKSGLTLHNSFVSGNLLDENGHYKVDYIYLEHNNQEIKKWITSIQGIEIDTNYSLNTGKIDKYTTVDVHSIDTTNLSFIKSCCFEHEYIANQLLLGMLQSSNTVHHIDLNPENNDKFNLMVFDNSASHKRFHRSKYAYLIYNEDTRLFSCVKKSNY